MSPLEFEDEGQQTRAVLEPTVVSRLERASIDVQIATAKQYPRSVTAFMEEVMTLVKRDGIAQECVYALPRKDKDGKQIAIEGPSARLAEAVMTAWGNCRVGAAIVEEGERFVVARGVFQDVERNVVVTYEVRRRITNRKGMRFNDDMIGVTANAACSIALRNAVFKGVPKVYWQEAYSAARAIIAGDEKTLDVRRTEALKYLRDMGVSEERVFYALGVAGAADIGFEEIVALRGFVHAIREGEASVETVFPEPSAAEGADVGASAPLKGTAGLKAKLTEKPPAAPEATGQSTGTAGEAIGAPAAPQAPSGAGK